MGKRAEMEQAAIRCYAEGMDIPAISDEIGVSENSLRQWKKRAGTEWDDARGACRKGYVASMESVGSRLARAREISETITGDASAQSKVGLSLNQALQTVVWDLIGQMQTAGSISAEDFAASIDQVKGLTLSLARLEQAAGQNLKREIEIRKQALSDAIKVVDEVAAGKKGGLSDEAANEIRRKILGIGA